MQLERTLRRAQTNAECADGGAAGATRVADRGRNSVAAVHRECARSRRLVRRGRVASDACCSSVGGACSSGGFEYARVRSRRIDTVSIRGGRALLNAFVSCASATCAAAACVFASGIFSTCAAAICAFATDRLKPRALPASAFTAACSQRTYLRRACSSRPCVSIVRARNARYGVMRARRA